jgi:hypothetical protein
LIICILLNDHVNYGNINIIDDYCKFILGLSYIETKNLDGETNLKIKSVQIDVVKMFQTDSDLCNNTLQFNYEKPSHYLYVFSGKNYLKINEFKFTFLLYLKIFILFYFQNSMIFRIC